jgi:hypothetical protein
VLSPTCQLAHKKGAGYGDGCRELLLVAEFERHDDGCLWSVVGHWLDNSRGYLLQETLLNLQQRKPE